MSTTTAEPPAVDAWAGMTDRALRLLNGPPKAWPAAIGRMDSVQRQRLSAVLDQLMAEAGQLAGYLDGRLRGWSHSASVDEANRVRTLVRRARGYTSTPARNIPEG